MKDKFFKKILLYLSFLVVLFCMAGCKDISFADITINEDTSITELQNVVSDDTSDDMSDYTPDDSADDTSDGASGDTSKWTITQYGQADGAQFSLYTIEDESGNLVIIDGGRASEPELSIVKEIIAKHNNHVAAWIVTHMHPDHVGAFNSVMSDLGDIKVDSIYTIKVNDSRYRETAKESDGIEAYDEFLNVISNVDESKTKIHYVTENDKFNVMGLEIYVLNSWNEDTDMLESNLMNNGAMVFLAKGDKKSMLFLADAEEIIEEKLYNNHPKEIENADFIQLAHHGNWGMTTAFYDHTSPDAVFSDAADFMFGQSPVKREYDAVELINYFEERNIKIYMLKDAPNSIVIQ